MDFHNLNESGSIVCAEEEAGFKFQYSNDFYGSGTFVARVTEAKNHCLTLDGDALDWQDYHLRRGNLEGLSKSAMAFFDQELRRYRSLVQLRGTLFRFDESADSHPLFSLLKWPSFG